MGTGEPSSSSKLHTAGAAPGTMACPSRSSQLSTSAPISRCAAHRVSLGEACCRHASSGNAYQPQQPVRAGRTADCNRAAAARLNRLLRGAEHQRAPVAGQQHLHRQQARGRRRGPGWLKRLFGCCSAAATVINAGPAAVHRAGLGRRRRRGARRGSSIRQGLRGRGRSQQVCHGVHQDLRGPRARPSHARPAGTAGRSVEQGALGSPAGACPRPAWTPRARAGAGGAARSAARRCA